MAKATTSAVEIYTRFIVRVSTSFKQSVWMVGNLSQLGSWKFSKRIPLSTDGSGIWQCVVKSKVGEIILYRYLICEELDGRNGAVMTAWESGVNPRFFEPPAAAGQDVTEICQDDGVMSNLTRDVPAGIDENAVSNGCLTGQTEIHLRFHNAVFYPINLWTISREQTKQLSIKVNASYISNTSQTLLPPDTIVKLLRGSVCNTLHVQPSCGESLRFEENTMLVFRTQTFHADRLMFTIYLYAAESSDPSQPLGVCWLIPEQLNGSTGIVTAIVLAGSSLSPQPIGSLSVDFLKIMPFDQTHMDLSLSYRHCWNRHQQPLNIGHRGMGMSFTLDKFNKRADIPENSVHSFLSAINYGADYIEFDVQLSRDKVPVLFHDLKMPIHMLGIDSGETEHMEVKVKDYTIEQLSKLKVASIPNALVDVPHKDMQFFSKLVEVFERVPEQIGFCIDIKYEEAYLDDESVESYFDRNEYADLILDILFKYTKSRPIVMASFDPDMCTILHLKQPRYPVLFLTCGVNDEWPVYRDVRQRSFESSLAYAKSEQLLGISAFSSPLLSDDSLVKLILDSGLILFTWGDDNNDPGNVAKLKEAGVHAVICDRISQLQLTV